MFGDRFHCTLRNYIVDTLFGVKEALSDMVAYIYTKKPYLQRRGDFDIYFKNGEGKDIHLTIIPK